MTEASSSESPALMETTSPKVPEPRPNRVILRMRVQDFDGKYSWLSYPTAVKAYLSWAKRSVTDYEEMKHNVYVEPLQDPEVNQRHFHIVIDFYSLSFDVQDFNQVQHEIFLMRRDEESKLSVGLVYLGDFNVADTFRQVMEVKQPAEAQNFIRKIRSYTDYRVPWGTDKAMDIATKK